PSADPLRRRGARRGSRHPVAVCPWHHLPTLTASRRRPAGPPTVWLPPLTLVAHLISRVRDPEVRVGCDEESWFADARRQFAPVSPLYSSARDCIPIHGHASSPPYLMRA